MHGPGSLTSALRRISAAASRPLSGSGRPWPATTAPLPPRRAIHAPPPRRSGAAAAASNPALSFPCLDALESRSAALQSHQQQQQQLRRSDASGPEPSYTTGATLAFHSDTPLYLDWGGVLPEFDIAYETWGTLDADGSNAILLSAGLSASSHARSTAANPQPGWWENFVGPGKGLDTDRFFVVCTNVIGGCYGSTGPSGIDPADGERYATRFPILTIEDMVRAQFRLLDHLGVRKLHASVGGSMGGMQSLAAGVVFPDRVGRVVTISGSARSHPYSIAMRHTQRQVLMMDPNWNRGFYYDGVPPHSGMKLAREIATFTYRSGPEWEQRFGRARADPSKPPALCPDFLIETYLDHAGEKFCLAFDPNSMLYISKAMDLFDLGHDNQRAAAERRARRRAGGGLAPSDAAACGLSLPDKPYEEQPRVGGEPAPAAASWRASRPPEDLVRGLAVMRDTPTLVVGAASDILFPSALQREIAHALRLGGNQQVVHRELSEEESLFGHDTFLLDYTRIGSTMSAFLKT